MVNKGEKIHYILEMINYILVTYMLVAQNIGIHFGD